MNDVQLATSLAQDAGDVLRLLQASAAESMTDTSELKDRGDRAAQEFLAVRLAEARPGDAVLSEEAIDDRARLRSKRVWIIDPLDGTKEFSLGRHDWAVHVALWEQGDLTAGAVALPGIQQVLSTDGSVRSWTRPERVRLAVSRSRATPFVQRLGDALDAELVPMGSAGFKVGAVIRGEVDAYVHTGGQYEWDSAAPVAVARSAGLFTSRLDGSPLVYNRPDPYLPDLVVCNPLLSGELRRTLDSLLEGDTDDRPE